MCKWSVSREWTTTSRRCGSCAWRAWRTCSSCSTSPPTSSSTAQSPTSSRRRWARSATCCAAAGWGWSCPHTPTTTRSAPTQARLLAVPMTTDQTCERCLLMLNDAVQCFEKVSRLSQLWQCTLYREQNLAHCCWEVGIGKQASSTMYLIS